MSPSPQDAGTASRTVFGAPHPAWLLGAIWAVLVAALVAPLTAHAGTITVVDGPAATQPADGVYTDGYIQNYLTITDSLTISTTGAITGADEIRVLEGAIITWTTGNTLTLDAGSSVIISGTIQHDGPATGEGGLHLLVSEVPTGTVTVGAGDQSVGVAAGSRFGLTRVRAGDLVLTGGSGIDDYAQLGYHAVDQGAAYSLTGPISVTVSHNLTATGGEGLYAFAQIGHGGSDVAPDLTPSGSFSGAVTVDAGENVAFRAGDGIYAYAQLGNGGHDANGSYAGDHRLVAGGDVTFQGNDDHAYAQLGNGGGGSAVGNHSGDHSLASGGNVTFQGGSDTAAYAQLGNGGWGATGSHSGDHSLDADGDVTFQGGSGNSAYAQLGNGGAVADGSYSGSHQLSAGGAVTFQGGSDSNTYAQLGNGGVAADGDHGGDHSLTANGAIAFVGGTSTYAYAQFGNGGQSTDGSLSGSLALTSTASLSVAAGSGDDAYAMLGHGSDLRIVLGNQGSGSRAGDISLRIGETAVFSGSQVGHLTAGGTVSVTQGNTLLGVSQNDPYDSGTGQLLVTGVQTTSFASAPTANGGELRFYLPRADSQQIPTNATFNGDTFAAADTIPPAQLAGFALFGDGPYIPDYSFYLGGRPDVALVKTATPAGPMQPGQALTYTVSFSNTGNITATNIVINDLLPGVLTATIASLLPDPGVVVSETNGAPNFAWTVSDLGPGQGGQIVLTADLQNTALGLGTTFTNTAAINATGDISLTNNAASVARDIVAAATLTVIKSVVGDPPAGPWQYTGSGGIGSFSLPAIGGSNVITGLIPTTYTITETVQSGYTAAVACTGGAGGTNSVQVTLAPGAAIACTFTNTSAGPIVRLRLPAIHVDP